MNPSTATMLFGLAAIGPIALAAQEPEPPTHRVSLFAIAASRFETNIDHDVVPLEDFGLIGGGRIVYDYAHEDVGLEASYEIGRHRYRETERWDRVGHNLRAAVDYDLGGRWEFDVAGEASFGGSTEDRELANVFSIKPRLTYEIDPQLELRFTGALRYKRIVEDPTRNATNPYGLVEIRRRIFGEARLSVGSRFEIKHTPRERSRYRRWTHTAELELPTWNGGELEIELKYRSKNYTLRLVEFPDGDEALRRDRRLIPEISWTQPLANRVDLVLEYEYENRDSNDFKKVYQAHAVGAALIFQIF